MILSDIYIMLKKHFFLFLIGVVIFGAIFVAYALYNTTTTTTTTDTEFINPTVLSDLNKHFIINFGPLKKELVEIQEKYPQKTYVYFSYLNNAAWVGLNERDLFIAASTIKVPLAMALLKAVEEGKIYLDDTYSLSDLDLDDNFGELYKVGSDAEFSLQELMRIMLEQSDNTAMRGIYKAFQNLGIGDPFTRVYETMGWQASSVEAIPALGDAPNYEHINLKTLANMFLSLYNADYIDIEHSNQILSYLANTPFDNKIAQGVPSDIMVAHKIGVATDAETFSDCGIVYAPNRNYLLCVGSNGGDEERAARFMAEVSKAVYTYVINN